MPKNSLNTKTQQLERPNTPCFQPEEQGERAKESQTRRVAGGWGGCRDGCRGSAGSHRALAFSLAPGGAEHAWGLCPSPLLRAFGSSRCFFQCKKEKPQMTLQPIICWLLAGCLETVTEAPLASATPFHRPGKAGAVISCGTRRAGNINYF